MISKTARQFQDPLIPVSIMGSARKFGNPVNKPDQLNKYSKPRHQRSERSHAEIQNIKPQLFYQQNQDAYGEYQGDKKYIISTFDPVLSQANSFINHNEQQKKQKQNRNRQFVAKVENINKIHEQISSLLQYVKNGHSKSNIRHKQIPQQRSKTIDYNPQNILRKKIKNDIEQRSIIQASVEQSKIYTISPQQRKISRSFHINQQNKQCVRNQSSQVYGRLKNNYLNPNRNQYKVEDFDKNLHEGNLNYEKNPYKKNIDSYLALKSNGKSIKTPQKGTQFENNKQLASYKQKFNYNFSNNQDVKQILKSKTLRKNIIDNQKSGLINYDYEITKVKERIQSSEQMTKKMEQRYLGNHQGLSKLNNINKSNNLGRPGQQDSHKNFKYKQQSRNGQSKQKQYRPGNNFQLKVYPCQPSYQNLSRDQVCRLIAEKISEQIKLDQRLRDARQIFNECKNSQKWNALQQKLKELGYSFTLSQLENELNISSSQSNPFSKDEKNKINPIQQLAQRYAKSQQYWEKKFFNFLSRKTVENSGFNVRQMDLDQRGYLTIQDIVCFVNLYSSNFFRNRDAVYLFRRLVALGKTRNGVQYDRFLNIISSQ